MQPCSGLLETLCLLSWPAGTEGVSCHYKYLNAVPFLVTPTSKVIQANGTDLMQEDGLPQLRLRMMHENLTVVLRLDHVYVHVYHSTC